VPNATTAGDLSYAQLKAVWLDASKGTRYHTNAWASLMAAIAEAESGGNPLVTNPNDNNGTQTAWGLWQVSDGTHNSPGAGWADPAGNARLAIAKLDSQGLTAWGTYNSGAYKQYLSDKSAPDYTLTNAPSAAEQAAATAQADKAQSCAWQFGTIDNPIPSFVPFIGGGSTTFCVLSKSQARWIVAVALILAGAGAMFTGLGWVVKAQAAGELGKLLPFLAAATPEGAVAGAVIKGTPPTQQQKKASLGPGAPGTGP